MKLGATASTLNQAIANNAAISAVLRQAAQNNDELAKVLHTLQIQAHEYNHMAQAFTYMATKVENMETKVDEMNRLLKAVTMSQAGGGSASHQNGATVNRGRPAGHMAADAPPVSLLQRFRAYSWNHTREDSEEVSSSKRRRQRSRHTHVEQCADAIMNGADEGNKGEDKSGVSGARTLLQVEDKPGNLENKSQL